ncbi:hypothetical protein HPG69_003664, partial [Diceros bicornis minor]
QWIWVSWWKQLTDYLEASRNPPGEPQSANRRRGMHRKLGKPGKLIKYCQAASHVALRSTGVPGIPALDFCPSNTKTLPRGVDKDFAVVYKSFNLKDHTKEVTSVVFQPLLLSSASSDATIRIWLVPNASCVQRGCALTKVMDETTGCSLTCAHHADRVSDRDLGLEREHEVANFHAALGPSPGFLSPRTAMSWLQQLTMPLSNSEIHASSRTLRTAAR